MRVLCQYYHTAERLHRPPPPPGRSAADPEAEATDRMVLEALAPDEGVTLWAERGRQLPRVQRCVREATARLQAVSAAPGAGERAEREVDRAERAERRAAELETRLEGVAAELAAVRLQLAVLEERGEGEEREALGESRPPGQPPPPPGVTLQTTREAGEIQPLTATGYRASLTLKAAVHWESPGCESAQSSPKLTLAGYGVAR